MKTLTVDESSSFDSNKAVYGSIKGTSLKAVDSLVYEKCKQGYRRNHIQM